MFFSLGEHERSSEMNSFFCCICCTFPAKPLNGKSRLSYIFCITGTKQAEQALGLSLRSLLWGAGWRICQLRCPALRKDLSESKNKLKRTCSKKHPEPQQIPRNSRGPAAKNIQNRSRYPATYGYLQQNLLKTAIGLSALSELNQQISYLHKGWVFKMILHRCDSGSMMGVAGCSVFSLITFCSNDKKFLT